MNVSKDQWSLPLAQELREQYENLADILSEMEEEKEQQSKASSFLNDQRNNDFLNKEISIFLDNLRKVR